MILAAAQIVKKLGEGGSGGEVYALIHHKKDGCMIRAAALKACT